MMWTTLLLLLKRQPGRSTLAGSGFLLAACALVLLSATTQTTVLRANQAINANWRPSYDLVVLPSSVKLPAGETVPADFLQSYDGGISIQQYAQIAHLPGVQVAAPLAYIGYLGLPWPYIDFPTLTLPEGYYQETWTMTAFNGQRHLIEYQQSIVDQIFPCADIYDVRSLDLVLQEQEKDTCTFGTLGYSRALRLAPPTSTGGFLLAAIDPQAENQLVHLQAGITTGRMLTNQDTIHLDPRIPGPTWNPQGKEFPIEAIPMLIHQQLPGQISMEMSFRPLVQGILSPQQIRKLGGAAYFARLPQQPPLFEGSVPMVQNDPASFANHRLVWDGHHWQVLPPSLRGATDNTNAYFLDFFSSSTPAGLQYRPATAPNGDPAYSLVPMSAQGPEVGFRPLQPLHTLKKQFEDVGYTYEVIGQFSDASLAAQFSNPLNWLPENTYTALPVTLRYDAQGHPIPPVRLLPTSNRAGFVMMPPLALTTLDAAVQLRGNRCISAIRIRVAGVEKADEQSWRRVQQVAAEITQRTHLQVVVTLGSSPRPTLVYVPGLKRGQLGASQDIAPLGWVEERWVSVGADILYLHQLGATQALLLDAVLLVCLGYLSVSMSALASAQRRDLGVLSALGWRPWHAAGLFLGQALMLSVCGGALGIGLALLLIALIGASPPWPIVVWAIPGVLLLAVLSALAPLWRLWHLQPAEVLRAGPALAPAHASTHSRRGSTSRLWRPAVGGLALRNLARARWRTAIAIGSLFLSALLLTVMVNGLLAFRQNLQGTLLGNDILLQTAVPQLAGVLFALVLTFLSVADLLLLQVRERQKEIGVLQAVGWRTVIVQRLFVQEGLAIAAIGTIPGVLVALVILLMQHTAQGVIPALLVGLGAVVLMLLAAAGATVPAVRAAGRLPLMEVLRGE